MRWLRITGAFLVVALIQATVLPGVQIGRARPDLLLVMVVYIAVREPQRAGRQWDAFWVGWIAGLMTDLYAIGSTIPFGGTALTFGIGAAMIARVGTELYLDSIIAQVLVSGAVAATVHTVLAVTRVAFVDAPFTVAIGSALRIAAYTAGAAPLVFATMRPLQGFFGVRSLRSFGRA
jgi:rod shape-determining protein MreD